MRDKLEQIWPYANKVLDACPSCGDDALDMWSRERQECDNCDFGKHEDAANIQDERDELRKAYKLAVEDRRKWRQSFREQRDEVARLSAANAKLLTALKHARALMSIPDQFVDEVIIEAEEARQW